MEHGRWAVIGDTLFRLLKSVGINVKNEFYINDAGNQIKLFNNSVSAREEGKQPPEGGYGGHFIDYIIENNTKSLSNVDFTIEYQKNTLKKLRCEFNEWFKETKLHKTNIIEEINTYYKDYIYEKDGALWFKTTDFGDDKDRVIKKDNGDLTYFAADIVYHLNKMNRGYNHIINIWGADHHGYIKRIESIIKAKQVTQNLPLYLVNWFIYLKKGSLLKCQKEPAN